MKKILLKFALAFTLIGMLITFSCEEPEPPIPDCEKYGYGNVTVVNKTGYSLWVDCTYILGGTNYEKRLYNNGSHEYKMNEGTVYIWASYDGEDWSWDSEYLPSCGDLTYRWYSNKKKSTNICPFVLDIGNGILVEPILGIKD